MSNDFGKQSDTLDPGQVEKAVFDKAKVAKRVIAFNNLVTEDYDRIELGYIVGGDGDGQVGTVTFKDDGGIIVAILIITYDNSDRISSVERT